MTLGSDTFRTFGCKSEEISCEVEQGQQIQTLRDGEGEWLIPLFHDFQDDPFAQFHASGSD